MADNKNVLNFLNAQLDNGANLEDLPLYEFLDRRNEQVASFLMERCKKGGKALEEVVKLALDNGYGLYGESFRVLGAALDAGYPAENLPIDEYIASSWQEEHKTLLDAVAKQGKGSLILGRLKDYKLPQNRSSGDLRKAYDYLVAKINQGKILGKKEHNYEYVFAAAIAQNERSIQQSNKTELERMAGYAKALDEKGAEAFKLFSIRTKDISPKKGEPNIHIGTYDLDKCPEFVPAATRVFKAETAKGLKEALNCAQIVPVVCWKAGADKWGKPIAVPEVLDVVKKYPPMLKAIDNEFPTYNEISPIYCDLAKAAVTNPNFDWKDLNISRLTEPLYRDKKSIYFDEQMRDVVTSAQKGGGKVPPHFAAYVSKGGSGRDIYTCKGD